MSSKIGINIQFSAKISQNSRKTKLIKLLTNNKFCYKLPLTQLGINN